MESVELFTGCGGLALGLSKAGFRSLRMSEWDKHSVANIQHNRDLGLSLVKNWPIHREDVRLVDWSAYGGVDLVSGGPPCQPFSIGGRHRGNEDRRDMWPEAVRSVREIKPRAFLFENVRGLLRPGFADYLRWVLQSLAKPSLKQEDGESRESHLRRLDSAEHEATYCIRLVPVNAADFGAPQKRHRVIIMGLHEDLGEWPTPPRVTHTRDRLLWDQWVTGDYWRMHGIHPPRSGPKKLDSVLVENLRSAMIEPKSKAWVTVRDAISGLGEPGSRHDTPNHIMQHGARAYPGHTGSLLDEPAKALKAGVHGVPGGENMMLLDSGEVRYFTVREAARLQGLPDDYEFIGSWSENMRQLGNAVPRQLSEAFARQMAKYLRRSPLKSKAA
ncbi:DNA (cytosine-5-)-methyltransferase [Tardiphaga sp.]|uniref:DNA cytosine methyltransferase n=1 Tax=Tardiphaga sp. TaxID=1926292 RepID=UPI00260051B0|nr:DNA (cytosine-5-)-methyltransferase [Tardiphaga sp.]